MFHEEDIFQTRVESPSFSDSSSIAGRLDEMENLELFPDLKELVTRQVSTDSEPEKPPNPSSSTRNVVAVRLDPGKEKELIDYLLGKSEEGSSVETNENVLQAIHDKVSQRQIISPKPFIQTGGGSTFSSVAETDFTASGREFEGKCMSKNAIAARENRLRKKQYIGDLEQSVRSLSAENRTLKSQVSTMQETVADLRTEVKYLKSVLANQSTLSALLKNIPTVSGINLTTSVSTDVTVAEVKKCRKRKNRNDSDAENIVQLPEDNNSDLPVGEIDIDSDNTFSSETMSTGGMCTRSKVKVPKLDHSYATNNPAVTRYQKETQLKARERGSVDNDDDNTGAGVCLHVSGSKVSLEFCSECSRRASTDD